MADAPELEFLRRTLVEPGLLAPEQLDAWRLGWPGKGSFFAHLVALGALARADAGTLGAVFKGYVKLPAASLLDLFKLEALPAERSGPQVTAAAKSSSALRAAIDAALSGLPMEPSASEPAAGRAQAAPEDMSHGADGERV